MNQSLGLLSDFKLGQYCKVPPRVTFFAQISGAVVGSILNYVMIVSESFLSSHRGSWC